MENGAQSNKVTTKKKKDSSIWSIFMHADTTDKVLMIFGLVGALGDGFFLPTMLLVTSKILNNLGNGPSGSSSFTHNINKNSLNLLYLACAQWVACFLEGYCWTRTAERQAFRMRARYLKAILRQDVEYFDLKGASTADVIISVSSDSLLIQDVLSEKVPNFLMNCSTFFGSYVIGFVLVWRLAIVAFPTVVLLIIPGLMYGRILMSLARKMREDYNKGGAIVEQAISSIRTVYSFVGESKTMSDFSAALENSVKLGLRQGLIKGIAIGSNGITFAIWAILAWYGSRLVMYHGGKGGDIFAVGATSIVGGL